MLRCYFTVIYSCRSTTFLCLHHTKSTVPLLGEMTATTLLSMLSRLPPLVATRSLFESSRPIPRSRSRFVEIRACASVGEILPADSSATCRCHQFSRVRAKKSSHTQVASKRALRASHAPPTPMPTVTLRAKSSDAVLSALRGGPGSLREHQSIARAQKFTCTHIRRCCHECGNGRDGMRITPMLASAM